MYVWLVAFGCIGLAGLGGFALGAVRAGFMFIGLLFGGILAGPLSPLTRRLLPALGLVHPLWQFFVPQALAYIAVVIIFFIAGSVVHRKIYLRYKYKAEERDYILWNRMYSRLGLCLGLANGVGYFLLLMIPVYFAGYFDAESAANGFKSPGSDILVKMRGTLHDMNLDRVMAAWDPTSPQIYQATDIADLVLHNPLLKARLAHYPPLLTLGQEPEFQALANDMDLIQMIDRQAGVNELIQYGPIKSIINNPQLVGQIYHALGNDLNDLQQYLITGKSAKYDSQPILGVWAVNVQATINRERPRHTGLSLTQLSRLRSEMTPHIIDLSLIATTDQKLILRQRAPSSDQETIVSVGSWKKDDIYEINLPGIKPETSEIEIDNDDTLLMPKDGYILVFDKEI